MKKSILLLLLCGLYISGCAVKQNPAHTTVITPYGKVDYHCPPGQRKKGRC